MSAESDVLEGQQALQDQSVTSQIPSVGALCVVRMPGQDARQAIRLVDRKLGDGFKLYQFEDVVGRHRFVLEEREVLAHVREKVAT